MGRTIMDKDTATTKGGKSFGIYSPWVIFYRQVEALFAKDPDIRVEYDSSQTLIRIFVEDNAKAEALAKIMPPQKVFGNVVCSIEIVPANQQAIKPNDFEIVFAGNEAFSHLTTITDIPDAYISNPITYCSFKKEVVQYPADDLGSESGMKSTLYEELAREVFGNTGGIFFCTDTE